MIRKQILEEYESWTHLFAFIIKIWHLNTSMEQILHKHVAQTSLQGQPQLHGFIQTFYTTQTTARGITWQPKHLAEPDLHSGMCQGLWMWPEWRATSDKLAGRCLSGRDVMEACHDAQTLHRRRHVAAWHSLVISTGEWAFSHTVHSLHAATQHFTEYTIKEGGQIQCFAQRHPG